MLGLNCLFYVCLCACFVSVFLDYFMCLFVINAWFELFVLCLFVCLFLFVWSYFLFVCLIYLFVVCFRLLFV